MTPRAAFFADTFHDVNGAARTCRLFQDFARRRGLPMLSVHAGPEDCDRAEGAIEIVELRRGRLSVPLDVDLRFDLTLQRHYRRLLARVEAFRPHVIHLTGPGDFGLLGARIARALRIPVAIAWHTNVHEFGARRLARTLAFLPPGLRRRIAAATEEFILSSITRFCRVGGLQLAPNRELVEMLEQRTGRPARLMERGVDTVFFDPAKRRRTDDAFVIGYVGRVQPEKNVRLLIDVERHLEAAGLSGFRLRIVGSGDEIPYLKQNLKYGQFDGTLHAEELAQAFASMDLFAFPSHTDTFGQVVQEAFASGVPAVVTASGGPKFIVRHGETGLVADSDRAFLEAVELMVRDRARHAAMRVAARAYAVSKSWDAVFEGVYAAYAECLGAPALHQPAVSGHP